MIHDLILQSVRSVLEQALIAEVPAGDPARAGVIKIGPLQGEPDPDEARISVELYANDPEEDGADPEWSDVVEETEVGGGIIWRRRFVARGRCLLEATQEENDPARLIAATVRSRMEKALLGAPLGGITDGRETVIQGVFSDQLRSTLTQRGGPGAYDYKIKVRFDVLTQERIGV